jgi:hypothetical protein
MLTGAIVRLNSWIHAEPAGDREDRLPVIQHALLRPGTRGTLSGATGPIESVILKRPAGSRTR